MLQSALARLRIGSRITFGFVTLLSVLVAVLGFSYFALTDARSSFGGFTDMVRTSSGRAANSSSAIQRGTTS